MDEGRSRGLLITVAVLAALRLLIVPWATAQSEARERLQVLTQRLDRSQGVLQARSEIAAADAALKAELDAVNARFPVAPEPQAFKLEAQRSLERLARAGGLEVKVFEVVAEGGIPNSGLSYVRMRLAVRGPLADAARLQAAIEALPHAAIREWNMTVPGGAATSPEVPGNAQLILDLYYRIQRT